MRRTITATIALIVLVLASMAPAAAQQTADRARAEAWGAQVTGIADLGPLPDPVVAEVPPGEQASDSFVEVPAEPAVFSATLSGNVEAAQQNTVSARLQDRAAGASAGTLPTAWNAAGHAITEELGALFAGGGGGGVEVPQELEDILGGLGGGEELQNAEPQQVEEALLTAEVLESEALAGCLNGSPVFATGSRVQRLTFGGENLGLLDEPVQLLVEGRPNEDVLANTPGGEALAEAGLEVIAWETNWDGATGTSGGDTVEVNALRVSVTEGSPLAELVGAQNVTVSHSEASVDCADADVGPVEEPGPDVQEPGTQPVDRRLPDTGGGVAGVAAAVLLGAGASIAAVRRWVA